MTIRVDEQPALVDSQVLVAAKTPLMPRPVMARMSSRLKLIEAVEQFKATAPADDPSARVIQQLAREMTAVHHFLAVQPSGLERVDPRKTTLAEIAVPREVKTLKGIEEIPIAAFEIQSYSRVGGN